MSFIRRNTKFILFCSAVFFGIFSTASAQFDKILDADQSDPRVLGWMQGFPPSTEKLIMQPQSNYFSFPKLRWTVCHIRELMPTELVSRGIGPPSAFEYSFDDGIETVNFTPIGNAKSMTWKDLFRQTIRMVCWYYIRAKSYTKNTLAV
jgi:hypothetical protein